jgi:hypothetical protein
VKFTQLLNRSGSTALGAKGFESKLREDIRSLHTAPQPLLLEPVTFKHPANRN